MNKEQMMRKLFEHIPAIVQCDEKAKWAGIVLLKDGGYRYQGCIVEPEDIHVLCKMEIPFDENGDLDLRARDMTSSCRFVQKYMGKVGDLYYLENQTGGRLSTALMEPIYPKIKPKMVHWTDEELLGAKFRCRSGIGIITNVLSDTICAGHDNYRKSEFFNNCTQHNGDKFLKAAK